MAVVEVIVQTFLAFGAILLYTRILGKQQVGQLTFFEYITGITFGSIAAVLATDVGTENTLYHFIGLTLFAGLSFLMGYASLVSRPVRKLVAGEPTIVIHNGKIMEENMRKMRYNLDELLMQLREKDVFDPSQVEFAVLEPNGNLSVLLKSSHRPVTPADLKVPTSYEGITSELVVDGQVIYQNLKQNNLDENWLYRELTNRGITDLKDVAFAALDAQGNLYVDLKRDNLSYIQDVTDTPP